MIKKLYIILMIMIAGAIYPKMIEISNDIVRAGVDYDTGRFTMRTLEASKDNPAGNNKFLLYQKTPLTSITTIYVDGETPIFGSDSGSFKKKATIEGRKIISEWYYKEIQVIQEISLSKSSSGAEDSMQISYRTINKSKKKSKIGIRILLDTVLGDVKPKGFGMPGLGTIEKETQLYKDAVPFFWYCFDNQENPQIKAQCTMAGDDLTKPDRIILAAWNRLYDNPWNFVIDSSRDFRRQGSGIYDSAVAMYFDPIEMDKEQTNVAAIRYGIYSPVIFSAEDLKTSLTVPDNVQQPPVAVAYELKNTSPYSFDRLTFDLTIPQGFFLSNSETNSIEFVKVETNTTKKTLWNLYSGTVNGKFAVSVRATAWVGSNQQKSDLEKSFSINYTEIKSTPAVVSNNPAVVQSQSNTNLTVVQQPVVLTPIVLSEQEKKVIGEILTLDKQLEDINNKYEILKGIYKNIYTTNASFVNDLNTDIQGYENILKEEEKSLTNLKIMLRE